MKGSDGGKGATNSLWQLRGGEKEGLFTLSVLTSPTTVHRWAVVRIEDYYLKGATKNQPERSDRLY
jgi:hypothetical protein